jgi:16S rRNA (cytosine967-C5)-methyltransferase
MVNAILRRIDREREKFSSSFAPTLNLPKWLKESWTDRFGKAEVENIAEALFKEPPFDFTLKAGCDAKEWAKKMGGILLPNSSLRVEKPGPIQNLPGYQEGEWWVQDVAASLPASLLGAKSGDPVLEFCAAPGGKTAQLADYGCQVTAVDQSARRLKRLAENMNRLGLACDVVTSDAANYHPDKEFRYILLDAPCSATGTLRRHPELSHTKSRKDIEALMILQARLLDHAVELLPVGGRLIYCVCSMENDEGPAQIKSLLNRNPAVKRAAIEKTELEGFERSLLPNGDVQTLPHHLSGGMDGFFISRLEKTGDR